jgi:PAS domain S-box-containing protein
MDGSGRDTQTMLRLAQLTIDATADAVFWIDSAGGFIRVNAAACKLLEYPQNELLTKTVFDVLVGYTQDKWRRYLDKLRTQKVDFFEAEHKTGHGRVVPVEATNSFMELEGNEYVCSIVRDITLRKHAENKLRESHAELEDRVRQRTAELEQALQDLHDAQGQLVLREKMASIGDLVAGVAHEINNPAGAVKSATDISNRCLDRLVETIENSESVDAIKDDKHYQTAMRLLRENVEIALEGGKRITRIVRSLKTFARLDETELTPTDIHEGLDSTLTLLHHKLKNRIEVKKNYGSVSPIYCYPQELNQVFMNLLANAIDAIPNKGTVHISTSQNDSHLEVQISDDGEGILEEHVKRVFDPGFTTKGVGIGTGLGLSISHRIVQKHKGGLSVSSRPNEGTTFTIRLPRDLNKGT